MATNATRVSTSTVNLQQALAAAAMLAPHLTVQDGKVCVLIPMTELAEGGMVRMPVAAPQDAPVVNPAVTATEETIRAHSSGRTAPRDSAKEVVPHVPKQERRYLRAVAVSTLRKNANLKKLPLTPRARVVLAAIHKQGPKGLAEKDARKRAPKTKARHFEHGPWSSTVDWLVKHGYVQKREADPRWQENNAADSAAA